MPSAASLPAQLELALRDDVELRQRVERELADPQWDFRTAQGLATALGVSPLAIEKTLEENPMLVRWVPIIDAAGRQLFVDRQRKRSKRELYLTLRAYMAKDVVQTC